MKRALLLASFCLLLYSDVPISWTPEYSMNIQSVGTVVPSPDATWVAYTQTRAFAEGERSEQVSQIYLARADGSRRFQLTRGEKGATGPQFSPDGRFLYFTSDRSGKSNVYRILIEGGEAEMLTDTKGSIGEFKLSPDGKTVAYTAYEPPADIEKARKEKRDFHVVDADPESLALYTIPADSKGKRESKDLTSKTKYHVASFDWSPDAKSIAFEHWPAPLADNWVKGHLAEVDVATGGLKELTHTNAADSTPYYSPDGRLIAFSHSSDPPRWPGDSRIALLTRGGGDVRVLPASFDSNMNLCGWAADSHSILFTEAKGTRTALYAMPVDGPPRQLYIPNQGIIGNATLNASRTHAGFAYENNSHPSEAYLLPLNTNDPVLVSHANLDVPTPPVPKTELIHWKSKDGLDIEGLLTYPVNYKAGTKAPMILAIHGGPEGVWGETYAGRFSIYPIATFAARGFVVLRPNPRGSTGYGKDFRFANLADWGGKDYEDDMAGVDKVISMGVADPDHLAVIGWSYGGYMTSWIVGHTNRFKAAVVGAGVTNLWSFTGTSDIPGFIPDYFRGEPWDQFEAFTTHSPITYVQNVKTPTLILHGEADVRVPSSQGYEFYHALKRLGVPTKMVVYPRTAHGPREPKFVLDLAQRHLDWVERYAR